MEEIDVNKIAAEFVNQNIESFYNTGKGFLKGAADKVRLHLNTSYKNYLKCVTERYSRAKSFFIRNEPTYLYEFYVPTGVTCGNTNVADVSILKMASVNPYAIITGSGGSGKSMLMRHLFLDAIIHRFKVPLFLELRDLSDSDQSLIEFIRATLHSNHFDLDDEYIEKAMRSGH